MAMIKTICLPDAEIDYIFWNIKTQEGIPKETHLHSAKMPVRSFVI